MRPCLKEMTMFRTAARGVLLATLFLALVAGGSRGISHAYPVAGGQGPWMSTSDESPTVGRFLVADSKLRDPNFARTVVLLVGHGLQGSTGLIVNRRSPFRLAEVLPGHPVIASRRDPLYLGGPVQPTRLMVLAHAREDLEYAVPVFDDVQLVVTRAGLAATLARDLPPESVRAYAGHAGWAAGQLDREIARGDWRVVEAEVGLVFGGDPGRLWQKLTDETMGKWVRRDSTGSLVVAWGDMEDAGLACHSVACLPIRAVS